MCLIKIFYIFVPNLEEFYLIGKKIAIFSKTSPFSVVATKKTDFTVKLAFLLWNLAKGKLGCQFSCPSSLIGSRFKTRSIHSIQVIFFCSDPWECTPIQNLRKYPTPLGFWLIGTLLGFHRTQPAALPHLQSGKLHWASPLIEQHISQEGYYKGTALN